MVVLVLWFFGEYMVIVGVLILVMVCYGWLFICLEWMIIVFGLGMGCVLGGVVGQIGICFKLVVGCYCGVCLCIGGDV